MTSKLAIPTDALSEDSVGILKPLKEKYGFTPNILALIGNNSNALGAVLAFAGAFDSDAGGLTSEDRHLVLIAASDENGCDYCRAAHTTAGKMSGLKSETIKRVLNNQKIGNSQQDALVDLVRNLVSKRGWADELAVSNFLDAGYSTKQMLAVIHGVAYKTFTNYVNHVFDVKVDEPFSSTLKGLLEA